MRLLSLFTSAVFQGLAWCQTDVIERASGGSSPGFCANASFAYPGWEAFDLQVTNYGISFQLNNNAVPSVNVSCSGNGTVSSSPSYLKCNDQTLFAYNQRYTVLYINQTWTCENTDLTFVGIGSVDLAHRCPPNAGECSPPDSAIITASLIAPVQITPQAVIAPAGSSKAGCTSNSSAATWDVNNLSYQRVQVGPPCNPVSGSCDGTQPLYYGDIEFDLVNTATGDKRHCGAQSLELSDLQGGDTDWFACDAGLVFIPTKPPKGKQYETTTSFRFNHPANQLELNQTWYCEDLGDADEYSFNAYGAVSPALNPTIHYIGNLTTPQITVNASSSSLVVHPTVINAQQLPVDTLQRPQAYGRSCTKTSLLSPPTSFEIDEFTFTTYPKGTSYAYFDVTNWMFYNELSFHAEGAALTPGVPGVSDPGVWYGCNGGDFSAPAGNPLLNCSFAFDRTSGRLAVREDWICADQDQEHPILFTAIAHGTVAITNSSCHTDEQTGNRSCQGPSAFSIAVDEFSWRSCAPVDDCPTSGSGFNWDEQFS